jgi:hypothetical protein
MIVSASILHLLYDGGPILFLFSKARYQLWRINKELRYSGDKPVERLTDITALSVQPRFGSDLSLISGLPNLEILEIKGRFKNLDPLNTLPNLRELALCNVGVRNLEIVNTLTGLESLAVSGDRIRHFPSINSLENLSCLYIGNTAIKSFPRASRNSCIDFVRLSDNRDLVNIDHVGNLKCLRELELLGSPILREVSSLGDLNKLESLAICDTAVDSIEFLGRLASLRELGLWDCLELRRFGVLGQLRQLRYLAIVRCSFEDLSILERHGSIQGLYLIETSDLSDLSALASMPMLRELLIDSQTLGNGLVLRQCRSLECVYTDGNVAALKSMLGNKVNVVRVELASLDWHVISPLQPIVVGRSPE